MNAKRLITAALILFVAVSIVYLVVQETSDEPSGTAQNGNGSTTGARPEKGEPSDTNAAPPELIAYYFHNTARCKTCLAIENQAKESLELGFQTEMDSGKIVWKAVNMEEPENKHFVSDYELAASSLVLVRFKDGEQQSYRLLQRVWELVDDQEAFMDYVLNETADLLGEQG